MHFVQMFRPFSSRLKGLMGLGALLGVLELIIIFFSVNFGAAVDSRLSLYMEMRGY
ncbi:hypothetical protein [Psychrobacillus sp. FJAT-51614]|uniref:hypothetical protein n=1 Tax=Psychrobacillus mangrovi TaxID=3117745 RepID=UPI003013256F